MRSFFRSLAEKMSKGKAKAGRSGAAQQKEGGPGLEQHAAAALAGRRWREAIEDYKQLLKQEARPQWREALAAAYLGRCGELAGKGMVKEAAALWENMAAVCADRRGYGHYLGWLARARNWERVGSAYRDAPPDYWETPAGRNLLTALAAHLVAGNPALEQVLPQESALRRQLPAAQAAVDAYCRGDDDALAATLRELPFRSPYRDLRTLLQGASAQEPQAAAAQLRKVPASSAFAPLAELLGLPLLRPEQLTARLTALRGEERALAMGLLGLETAQRRLLGDLLALKDHGAPSAKEFYSFLMNHVTELGAASVQRMARALLPHYPSGLRAYEKRFGRVPSYERHRVAALRAELEHDDEQIVAEWRLCIKELLASGDKQERLMAALTMRRYVHRQTDGGTPPHHSIPDLAHALELDPDDRAAWLELAELSHRAGDKTRHGQVLEQALKRFPDDAEVLMTAANAAARRRAYKKATDYARRLLALDPINRAARQVLLDSALAHAAKQVAGGKAHLAHKTLAAATADARDDNQRGQLEMADGLVALPSGDGKARESIETGLRRSGADLRAGLRLLVEGTRFGVNQRQLTPLLAALAPGGGRAELMGLFELVRHYRNNGLKGVADAVAVLEPRIGERLQALAELELAQVQFICEELAALPHHPLLFQVANRANRRWHDRPRFVYYEVLGKNKGRLPKRGTDLARLKQAERRAADEGDRETLDLIAEYRLPGIGSMRNPFGMPGMPELREVQRMIEQMSPAEMEEAIRQMAEMIGNDLGMGDFDDDDGDDWPPRRGRRR